MRNSQFSINSRLSFSRQLLRIHSSLIQNDPPTFNIAGEAKGNRICFPLLCSNDCTLNNLSAPLTHSHPSLTVTQVGFSSSPSAPLLLVGGPGDAAQQDRLFISFYSTEHLQTTASSFGHLHPCAILLRQETPLRATTSEASGHHLCL